MKLNLKMLAVSAALLGLLAAGAALPASAAGPLNAAAALSLPWSAAAVESVETGTYASTMTVGTQQQLSPVILPAKAARKATVTFISNDSTIVNVTSEGVAQAVGVGTAQVIASADGVSCVYTITTELDESMIVKEMDITLASGTIAVGETTSLSLGVLPSSASNYASVSLSSSDPAVATVNNFGKVTGVAPGTATITATCGDVSASATVKVVNSGVDRQSIDLNTSYVVLKPGASRTVTGKVTPSSASQSLTFKSNDTKVATVSAKGVITAVGTGATSIVVSNGTASASVTVIVNRNASSSGNGGGSTDDSNGEVITDPVVEAIEADGTDEVTFPQRELPTITGEMLNALRLNGKTLVVEADNYTIRIAGRDVKNTSAQVSTALSFAPSEYGVTFTLNGGEALPGVVQVEMTGDNAAYTRVYLHNALKGKWQFLNSYKDHVLEADTAGEYLLTTKLFCGHCKEMMVGYGGTSKTGRQYHYYMCKNARRKKCGKKIVSKSYIEDRVVHECLKMLTEEKIRFIAKKVAEECAKSPDNLTAKSLKKAIREADTAIENLWKAIEQGQAVEMLTEAQILAFLDYVCEMPADDVNKRRAIINIFVHSIYLYDDHFTLIINASKKPLSIDNIPLDDIETAFEGETGASEGCSSLSTPAPPNKNRNFDTMGIKIAVLSFCPKALISRASGHLSAPVALMQSDSLPPTQSAKALGSSRLSFVLWLPFNLWAIV